MTTQLEETVAELATVVEGLISLAATTALTLADVAGVELPDYNLAVLGLAAEGDIELAVAVADGQAYCATDLCCGSCEACPVDTPMGSCEPTCGDPVCEQVSDG